MAPTARAFDVEAASASSVVVSTVMPVTIVGVITISVLLKESEDDTKAVDDDEQTPEVARLLIDSALLTERQDLGILLVQLARSPAAFDALKDDVQVGHGASLDALVQSTRLSRTVLIEHHRAVTKAMQPVSDQELARHFVMEFLTRLGPELTPPPSQVRAILSQLAREQEAYDRPGQAPGHQWLSGWLAVPSDAVGEVVGEVLGAAQDKATPDALLDAIATRLEDEHRASIRAQVDALAAQSAPWISTEQRHTAVARLAR